ncbi:CYTH domain-containing protein [Luteimonas sp. MJ293]|uniref:CYTH domain-containing protein n=1 Tax=Luteimonas sp. MJ146 TaxID=3129240 RepID=UPI0031BB5692
MAIEIERKFLVTGSGWREAAERSEAMAQGYLNQVDKLAGGDLASVRVRLEGPRAALNIKSCEAGRSRQEFEYPLPVDDARALLALCTGGKVQKQRHYVRHGAHLWEVDEFEGDNAGLVVAEIELGGVDEEFQRPDWLGAEVTDFHRYYNIALSKRPFTAWSDAERQGPEEDGDAR